jgi:hypothetical protein
MLIQNTISLPADANDNYEEFMKTLSNDLEGLEDADPWVNMPSMEQLTFDLLDIPAERPFFGRTKRLYDCIHDER